MIGIDNQELVLWIAHFHCQVVLPKSLLSAGGEVGDFSSLCKEKNLLTDLFSATCSDPAWRSNNRAHFAAIVGEINALEEDNNTDPAQLEKIASICKKTLLSPHEAAIEALLLPTYEKALSLESAFDFLLSAEGKEENQQSPLVERSLEFITEKTGCDAMREENGQLRLKIARLNDNEKKLMQFISAFDDERRKDIILHLNPDISLDKEALEALVNRCGNEADMLTLDENITDDEQLEKIILNCPKINSLCINNRKITVIPSLPEGLASLDCEGCTALKKLPDLLPSGLRTLNFSRCIALREIPTLPADLMNFNCSSCSALIKIPTLPAGIGYLYCSWCESLKELPALTPGLRFVYSPGCRALTSSARFRSLLPLYQINPEKALLLAKSLEVEGKFLSLYAKLIAEQGNDANGAPLLSFFTEIDFYQTMKGIANGNQLLAQYGEERIRQFFASSIGKFSVMNETIDKFLKDHALLNLLMTIYPPVESDNYRLYLRSRLERTILRIDLTQGMALQRPDPIFEEIRAHAPMFALLTNIKVKHPESPGIDADGLGRQFIADFIRGIVTNSQLFTFETCYSGKRRPVEKLEKEEHEKELADYQTLGAFLGLALKINYKTGLLFSAKLFGAMRSFSSDELDQDPFDVESFIRKKSPEEFAAFFEDAIDNEGFNQFLFPFVLKILTSQDENAIKEAVKGFQNQENYAISDNEKFVEAIGDLDKAETAEAKLIAMNKIKSLALDEWLTINRGYLEIAHALAKGIKELLSNGIIIEGQLIDSWEKLQVLPPAAFLKALEGELSAESIKNNLIFNPENHEMEGWMKKWLDDHAHDEKALGNFLREVTGAPVLQGPIRVKLVAAIPLQQLPPAADGSPRSYQPSHAIHTCFSTIDFLETIDEKTFIAALDACAVESEAEFNQD